MSFRLFASRVSQRVAASTSASAPQAARTAAMFSSKSQEADPSKFKGYLKDLAEKPNAQAARQLKAQSLADVVAEQEFSYDWEELSKVESVPSAPLDDRLLPIYDEQFDPDEWENVEEEDVDAHVERIQRRRGRPRRVYERV